VNHGFANELGGLPPIETAPCPAHLPLEPIWKQAA
jgi:ubiquinol oxidase